MKVNVKTKKITHQDVGQMDMYVRMYDELKKAPDDNPTIGIVLCSETDEDIARYSVLKGNEQLFASKYKLYLPTEDELSKVSWSHNLVLMSKIKDENERNWYINETIKNGWARSVLIHQIEYGLYDRSTAEEKTHNFPKVLPPVQSELAIQTLKDPYIFDFLTLAKDYKEKDLEDQLVKHITQFLLELGAGFAFVGRQYHLEIGGDDYYIDLLFYHLKLKCYVVIELKTVEFQPEFARKIELLLISSR